MSKRRLLDRLAGPNALLNLSYSIHPPFLLQFERRIFCDLDPSEIFYWMTKMELGQSSHDEFWTIGLNAKGSDCQLPKSSLRWKTFYPLADTKLLQSQPRPGRGRSLTLDHGTGGGPEKSREDSPTLSRETISKRIFV